jgi:hypothetical protein
MAVTSHDVFAHLPDDLTEGGKQVAVGQGAGELLKVAGLDWKEATRRPGE